MWESLQSSLRSAWMTGQAGALSQNGQLSVLTWGEILHLLERPLSEEEGNCGIWTFSSVQFIPLTDLVVGGTLRMIQQRSFSSLFSGRPQWLWSVLARAGKQMCKCVQGSVVLFHRDVHLSGKCSGDLVHWYMVYPRQTRRCLKKRRCKAALKIPFLSFCSDKQTEGINSAWQTRNTMTETWIAHCNSHLAC